MRILLEEEGEGLWSATWLEHFVAASGTSAPDALDSLFVQLKVHDAVAVNPPPGSSIKPLSELPPAPFDVVEREP